MIGKDAYLEDNTDLLYGKLKDMVDYYRIPAQEIWPDQVDGLTNGIKLITKEQLSKRLHEVFQDNGVDVWDSEFI